MDPLFTPAAAAKTRRDPTFTATLPGPTYAQPLYIANGARGRAALLVVTEQNVVLMIDAADGSQLWVHALGAPVPVAQLPCGDIDPLGITGTPVVDASARVIYVAAMTTPDGGATKQHRVFGLSLDDGSTLPGWPLDVNGITNQTGPQIFNSTVQNQRGALLLNSGTLYVPHGGHAGDCGGTTAGSSPCRRSSGGATAWATRARAARRLGAWRHRDRRHVDFAATGNTFAASTGWRRSGRSLGAARRSAAPRPIFLRRRTGRISMQPISTWAARALS